MRIGLLPLARATFDVAFAEERFNAMLARLDEQDVEIVGSRELLFDGDAARTAVDAMTAVDRLLVLQVTFTDAGAVLDALRLDVPVAIWAVPEPRLGGRLRLNAFCGLNLAAHALGRRGHTLGWLYADPDGPVAADLRALLQGERDTRRLDGTPANDAPDDALAGRMRGRRIARLGAHPDGFETCRYDAETLQDLAGVHVEEHELDTLFAAAATADPAPGRAAAEADVTGLDAVDPAQLERSLAMRGALDTLKAEGGYDAFAIRCWPETFTEYGGAVCGAVAQMGERRTPCACEADVYGAVTQLLLQDASDAPVFLVDVVDMDANDGTGVVWHCGQAPVSMASSDHPRTATIHTNRKQPLLYEFPLRPGPVTLVRVSQAWNDPRLVIAGAEMLARDKAFTGTSGTLRFENGVASVLDGMMDAALEHHVALAYGDHRPRLRGAAAAMGLPVVEL